MKAKIATGPEKTYIKIKAPFQEKKTEPKKSLLQKLSNYINKENLSENRLKWVGLSMVIQAALITPIVGLIIILTGNHLLFWGLYTSIMYLTFIPGLTGASVKAVLSTFIVSIMMCITIIVSAIGVYIF